MRSIAQSFVSSLHTIATNRLDDASGRPYQMRASSSCDGFRGMSPGADRLRFGRWTIGSVQRRKGEANNYRRHILDAPEIISSLSVTDLMKYLKRTLRDIGIPYAYFPTKEPGMLAEVVTRLHNMHYLDSTIVVVPYVNDAFHLSIKTSLDSIDYTKNPTDNARADIYWRDTPKLSAVLDCQHNTIHVVTYKSMTDSLICDNVAYHYRALVLFFNSKDQDDRDMLQQGAKYISSQVLFVDTEYFPASASPSELVA